MVASIDVVLNTQLTTSAEIQITVLRDHKVLENLDYENSGHTGFASEEFVNNSLGNKVDKVEGKSLTSNDFTNDFKNKLSTIEANAQKNNRNFSFNLRGFDWEFFFLNLISNYNEYDTVERITLTLQDSNGNSYTTTTTAYIFEKKEMDNFETGLRTYYFNLYNIDRCFRVTITDINSGSFTYEEIELLTSKVSKVAGKGLSTNDFNNEYKSIVDSNKQNIESLATQLSLYQFTRQQIVSKFLDDYSSYVGFLVTVENYLNAPRLTFEFLRNHSNWSWLKQWIISCRSEFETNQTWLTNFLDGNETFWAYEMKAFLSETYQATYPGSTDYTIDAYANGWRPPSTIDELNSRVSALEANKVDRVEGKGLSTNDYDNTSKEIVDNLLNEEGQINSNLLPSYVDDVMEFTIQVSGSDFLNQIINQDIGSMVWIAASKTYTGDTYYRKFAINKDGTIEGLVIVEPESGKIYVGKSDTNTYRWSGSNLVEISKSIGLGETTTTAYAGNKGKNNALAISELQARLPVPPTTQGTYKLNAIVDSNGLPTYVWSIE